MSPLCYAVPCHAVQTFILSISGVAFTGGFGTYLTGMSYQTYLNMGGAPRNSTAFDPSVVYDPNASRTIPYLLLTAVLGVFMLTSMRKLMIIDWRLPFPSGTASGIMLQSFHTAVGVLMCAVACASQLAD